MPMTAQPLVGFVVRPATFDDVPAIVELENLCRVADGGSADFIKEQFLTNMRMPHNDIGRDIRLYFTPEGRLIGVGRAWAAPPYVRLAGYGCVHPDYRRRGIGSDIFAWYEQAAQRLLSLAEPNKRIHIFTSTVNDAKAASKLPLYRKFGYTHNRSFYKMQRDLTTGAVPAPDVPAGLAIRTVADGVDPRKIHAALNEAFSDHWGFIPGSYTYEQFEKWMLGDSHYDPTLFYAVMDGDEVAAIGLCFQRTHDDADLGWVEDLGVRRAWRKRGLGLALLHQAFGEMQRRGVPRAGLEVDSQNLTGALRLYERAGMHPTDQYDRYEKTIRDGEELGTQSAE